MISPPLSLVHVFCNVGFVFISLGGKFCHACNGHLPRVVSEGGLLKGGFESICNRVDRVWVGGGGSDESLNYFKI